MDTEYEKEMALEILELVGNKWTMLVTYRLGQGAMRFSDLKRVATPITSKMLTQTLRELECFGMVSREVLPSTPPAVEYRLTELGASLMEPAADTRRMEMQRNRRFIHPNLDMPAAMPGWPAMPAPTTTSARRAAGKNYSLSEKGRRQQSGFLSG